MRELKATPGPWHYSETATHATVIDENNDAVFHDDKRIPGVVRDAHLIAAAPDGYALAKLVMEVCGNPKGISERDQEELYEAALQYAKKARGES